jgi:dihydrolipoamide dehydrogenase
MTKKWEDMTPAARLLREARQLSQYGIVTGEPVLEYPRLLARVREVTSDVRTHSLRREYLESLGVTIYEKAGAARFVDPHTIETQGGLRLRADKFILCGGGTSRRLPVPGFELTATHSDAWAPDSGPAVDVGGGRGAGRLDLQRLRLTGAAVSERLADPVQRG